MSRQTMSRQTMSFALPESMREYIDNRVAAGSYGNTSESPAFKASDETCSVPTGC